MIVFDNDKKTELVPTSYPYGSITDGTVSCARCGDDITGCALCAGQPVILVTNRTEYTSTWGMK